MPIKLITLNDVKISLSRGEHVFGRYKILNANDKRVSREHGQLQVNTETIVLKSLHQNPCYYKKKGSTKCETLSQDNSVTLTNGDKFGLIPEMDKLWYEVMYIADTEDEDRGNIEEENCCEKVQNSIPPEENILEETEINTETYTNTDNICENNDTLCNTTESQQGLNTGDKSPSLLNQDETSSSTITENEPNGNESRENSPNIKRSHSDESSDVNVKKVKLEEQSDDTNQSTSDQASTSNANDGEDTKPPYPLRERCMYGANCYRKNPVHLAQFSHPRDADWGAGARGRCPYGAACAKRDPRHWRDHDHPPGAAPPAPRAPAPGQGSKIVERHGNVFIITAHSVNFYDDHFQVTDSEGDSADYDYEF